MITPFQYTRAKFACDMMHWDIVVIVDGFMRRRELRTPEYLKLQRVLNHAYTQLVEFFS
jgi:hypothetical protein